MKKFGFAVVIVAVLVVALFSVGSVSAKGRTPTPNTPQTPNEGFGMMRGGGMAGGMMGTSVAAGDEILHDELMAIYSAELGISVEDLTARLDAGETLAQIAYAEGLSVEEFRALMSEAHAQAVAQAVADGTLTQEQAEWMNQRGSQMSSGMVAGRGGMRGANAGTWEDCPIYPQTNP